MQQLPASIITAFILIMSATVTSAKNDTTFYTANSKVVDRTDPNVYSYSTYTATTNHQYDVTERYVRNNAIKMTGHVTNIDSTGLRNGRFVYFNEDGNKSAEGTFDKDKRNGDWQNYYDDGKNIWHTDLYEGDKIIMLTSYYKSGKIKRRETYEADNVVGKCFDEKGKEIAFTRFETMPSPGFELSSYLSTNLHYPKKARRTDMQGRVIVKFVIDESGAVTDATVVKRIGKECDDEALRVVNAMPKWTPGIQDDKRVKVYFTLPIVFRLED